MPKSRAGRQKVMPEDHSELVPLLPIPNRTVKRLSADDSADTRVKVGHSQAIKAKRPGRKTGLFFASHFRSMRRFAHVRHRYALRLWSVNRSFQGD